MCISKLSFHVYLREHSTKKAAFARTPSLSCTGIMKAEKSRSCTNQIINCLWMSAIKSRNQVDSELMANVIWSRNWICLIHLSVSDIHTASYNSVLNAPSWRFSPVTMDRLRLPSFFKIAVSHFVSK